MSANKHTDSQSVRVILRLRNLYTNWQSVTYGLPIHMYKLQFLLKKLKNILQINLKLMAHAGFKHMIFTLLARSSNQ